ncbi:MAG TPA: hypothetical protein VLE19_04540 [Pyrinomonadaceae bacterium]|nr:hypothetical protein [Pyrinomonadaceae bacterium]
MLRTIAIALILLISVGVMLPFTNSAHGVRQSAQVSLRRNHRYHSRAWWRRYRARLRKKRAAAALAHRNLSLGQPQSIPVTNVTNIDLSTLTLPTIAKPDLDAAPTTVAPTISIPVTNLTLPQATTRFALQRDSRIKLPNQSISTSVEGAPSPMTLRKAPANFSASTLPVNPPKASAARAPVKSTASILPGQMNLSVVALSRPNPVFLTPREEKQMLAGTSVSELRHIVIDKMIEAGGWVTNDFIREVNGSRVFVVTARTPRDRSNPEKAWTFYFTESDGRIYGLTTDAPLDSADRMSTEAERFINKLHSNSQPNDR